MTGHELVVSVACRLQCLLGQEIEKAGGKYDTHFNFVPEVSRFSFHRKQPLLKHVAGLLHLTNSSPPGFDMFPQYQGSSFIYLLVRLLSC